MAKREAKQATAPKLPAFPEQIYLTDGDDPPEHFWLQHEDLENIDGDARVAVYKLVRTSKLVVKRELVKP